MVAAGDTPVAIAVSGRTHTIYVADYGSGATGTISVLDARACARPPTRRAAPFCTR